MIFQQPRKFEYIARYARLDVGMVALGLMLLVAWDLSGIDMSIARWFGGSLGFPLRDSRWALASYDAGRLVAWIVVPMLFASLWFTLPGFRKVDRAQRAWWLLTTIACLVAIPLLRSRSSTSCPWSITEFGGSVPYVSHWWRQIDAGPGRCFPSGHASTGFAFFAGFFALRGVDRAMARRWLAGAIALGLLAAITQTLRGAHFVSHSLWTAWICWTMTTALHHAWRWAAAQTTRRATLRARPVVSVEATPTA
jgi:membrane-associated PAP2 superfamily phosphatase